MGEGAWFWAAEGIALLLLPGCERNIKQTTVESSTGKCSASVSSAFYNRVSVALFVLMYTLMQVFQGHRCRNTGDGAVSTNLSFESGSSDFSQTSAFLRLENAQWWGPRSPSGSARWCCTILTVRKFSLMPNLRLPWCSLNSLPLVKYSVNMEHGLLPSFLWQLFTCLKMDKSSLSLLPTLGNHFWSLCVGHVFYIWTHFVTLPWDSSLVVPKTGWAEALVSTGNNEEASLCILNLTSLLRRPA